jgi:HK97 family phage major capsid protein
MNKKWIQANKFVKLKASEVEALTEEEYKEYMEDLASNAEEEIKARDAKIKALEASSDDHEEEIKTLKAEQEALGKIVDAKRLEKTFKAVELIGKDLAEMKRNGAISQESFESQLKAAWDDNFSDLEEALKTRTSSSLEVVKATQTYGDIDSGSDFAQMRQGVYDKPVRMPRFRSLFGVIPVNTEFYKYSEQDTVVRDAQNVAKCAAVTSNTKETIKVSSIQTKVIKDTIDFCRLFVEDYPFMQSRINRLLTQSLALRIDAQILLGDGIGENTFSIDYYSSEFNAANPSCDISGEVQAATLVDLILGMQTQIVELGEQNAFDPDYVIVNKCDWFVQVESRKDANNNYLDGRVTTVNGIPYIGGMQVIWSPIVAQNTCYVMDSTKGEIVDRQTVSLDISFENKDNWEKEIATLKGYERLNLLVPNEWINAFMKCSDVATAIAAITKP